MNIWKKEKQMKLSLLLISSLLVSGCACRPIIETKDQRVEVPVLVPCKVEFIPLPSWPVNSLTKEDDIHKKVQVSLAELEEREAYEKKLRSALKACDDSSSY